MLYEHTNTNRVVLYIHYWYEIYWLSNMNNLFTVVIKILLAEHLQPVISGLWSCIFGSPCSLESAHLQPTHGHCATYIYMQPGALNEVQRDSSCPCSKQQTLSINLHHSTSSTLDSVHSICRITVARLACDGTQPHKVRLRP